MDDGFVGILVFGSLALAVALVCHRRIGSFWVAVLVSGPVAALLFQLVAALHVGYVDPFFLIAFVTTTAIGWGVSWILGLVLRGTRSSRSDDRDASSRGRS